MAIRGMASSAEHSQGLKGKSNVRRSQANDLDLREKKTWPKDCSEVIRDRVSGVFFIQPTDLRQIIVYCDFSTSDGWTVLQGNHKDTGITWAEFWSTHRYGFGNVQENYWPGMEYMHQIAKQKVYQVKFVIYDSMGSMKYSDYNLFGVEDESKG
ncbi:hypothetical protein Y1Q_0015010 [Alligator mississippiensis]|uniref:Fibrinogen C-terminal domain-containing protein n=1 Tax=Alligator mississippiensis TaxID=8496 RepID=A0A151N8U9_ALLMI|nr:hypothetical protein Y1Q_0015010 [Alligator mississippiensis]